MTDVQFFEDDGMKSSRKQEPAAKSGSGMARMLVKAGVPSEKAANAILAAFGIACIALAAYVVIRG